MKVKLHFDKRTIQAFLLQNAEKLFAGVVVLGTLLILYFSYKGVERFDRTPDGLQQQAARANKRLRQRGRIRARGPKAMWRR